MSKDEPQFYIATDDGYTVIGSDHWRFSRDITTVERGHPLLKATVPGTFRPFTPTYPWPPTPEGASDDHPADPAPSGRRGAKARASR